MTMAEHTVNAATGEVTLEIDGEVFRIRASMARLADLMGALAVPGLGMLQLFISQVDPRALYHGMRCLCTSGNEAKLRDMLLMPHVDAIKGALLAALIAGLPEPDKESEGKGLAEAATATMN